MKKVWTSLVTFIFSLCLIFGTVAPASAAAMKKVTNFKASATPVAVTLTWSKVSGAKNYEIQQKSGKKWKKVATVKQKTTTYTVKKLKNGTNYQFRIYAVNGKKKSKAVSVKVKTGVQKITGVTAASTGLKSAKLTWAKGNVTGYEIQRKVGKKWKTVKKIKKANTTTLSVSNIAAGQSNSFRIRGYVNGGAKIYYGAYTTVNVTTAVAPMKNASVKSVTDKAVTLSWAKINGVSGYQLQRKQGNKWVDVNKAIGSGVTQYTVNNLSAFANQQFQIRAYQKDGGKTFYNSWKPINAKTAMGTVSGLTYTGLSADKVTVKWNAAGGAAGYRVYNNGAKIADVKTNSAVLNLKAATAYKITVAPYNGGTTGKTSSAISFTSKCAKVTGVKATQIAETSVTVAWTATTGATSYQLQYCKDGVWSSDISVTGTSYQVKDLDANYTYSFRIRALNKNGSTVQYGNYSDAISATTKGVSFYESNAVSWNSVDKALYYEVQYYNSETFSWEVVETNIDKTYYSDEIMFNDAAKLVRVVAYDNNNNSIYTSNIASVNASDIKFSIKDNIISASWSKYDGAKSYEVRIKSKGMNDNGATVIKATDSNRSVTSSRLAPGLVYEVTVVAKKGTETVELASFDLKAGSLIVDNSDKSKNDQLLYLVEAVNRSKFDYSHKTYIDTSLEMTNNINYMEFGIMDLSAAAATIIVDPLLKAAFADMKGNCEIKGGYIKCYDQAAVNSLFGAIGESGNDSRITEVTKATFNKSRTGFVQYKQSDGTFGASKSIVLDQVIQPANELNQLAKLYNSDNASAWKNGFESVNMTKTNDGYKIVAVIKSEKSDSVKGTEPVYHAGLVNAISAKGVDLGMPGGKSDIKSTMGKTTLIAEIDSECRLKRYEINMPYQMDMNIEIPLSAEEISGDSNGNSGLAELFKELGTLRISVAMKMSGSQHSISTFTRSK